MLQWYSGSPEITPNISIVPFVQFSSIHFTTVTAQISELNFAHFENVTRMILCLTTYKFVFVSG